MKRKLLAFLLSSVLACGIMSGCTASDTSSSDGSSGSGISSSQSASDNESNSGALDSSQSDAPGSQLLLMKTFGELWMGTEYYIDVSMRSEYDTNAVAKGSASEISEGYVQYNYNYIIAVDAPNDKAGVNIISDRGNLWSIYSKGRVYTLYPSSETYVRDTYPGDAVNFGEEYTIKLLLGIINTLSFKNTGKTTYNGQEVTFEKYRADLGGNSADISSLGEVEVTYYFDENEKPVAEIVRTSVGVTTFNFNVVSSKIESDSVMTIPDNYTELTDQTSTDSEEQ